jgi:hypothetical protein
VAIARAGRDLFRGPPLRAQPDALPRAASNRLLSRAIATLHIRIREMRRQR